MFGDGRLPRREEDLRRQAAAGAARVAAALLGPLDRVLRRGKPPPVLLSRHQRHVRHADQRLFQPRQRSCARGSTSCWSAQRWTSSRRSTNATFASRSGRSRCVSPCAATRCSRSWAFRGPAAPDRDAVSRRNQPVRAGLPRCGLRPAAAGGQLLLAGLHDGPLHIASAARSISSRRTSRSSATAWPTAWRRTPIRSKAF